MRRTLTHFEIRLYVVINIVFCYFTTSAISAETVIDQKSSNRIEIKLSDTDIAVTVYPASNSENHDLILWLPSEHGLPDSIFNIASALAFENSQTEVWVVDLLSSLFLPTQASSINKVPHDTLYQLVQKIHSITGKRIFILGAGRGALLAMRASHYWLRDSLNSDQFGGLILLYPNLYTATPEPGSPAEYYPVTHAVNVPIYILQPENSPWRWQLTTLQQHLITANAKPYISILPEIRDRFFFRPDATKQEQLATQNLAATIQNSIGYLKSEKNKDYKKPPVLSPSITKQYAKQAAYLKPYKKDPVPAPLSLATLSGQTGSLNDYRGKVIIVNFWASWCPPCVHEMPSMEKLYQKYSASAFTILAVNMAEDVATIKDFIQNQVNVSFPILLDSDGKALQDWQVFAFPSSFVIDKTGKIRYALFGSILWDKPEVIEIIEKLINEPVNLK
ncbi:MAG: redoxin domain-containing protein [Gammaproteobacteria bacterium]